MNRRECLAALGTVSAALTGCSSPFGGSRGYEECDAPFVLYDSLPRDVRSEVDSAFDDGTYETDGDLLYDEAVSDDTPLGRAGTLYGHRVDRDGDVRRLSFEEWAAYPSPVELAVRNDAAETVHASVRVTDEGGATVFEKGGVALEPDGGSRRFPVTAEFGEYEFEVATETGRRAVETWRIGPTSVTGRNYAGTARVSENGIEFDQTSVEYDRPVCPWE